MASDLAPTPGHTVGPFFHDALGWAGAAGADDQRIEPAHRHGHYFNPHRICSVQPV